MTALGDIPLTQEITGLDGWVDDSANTWTYASASTFTVVGDRTAVFTKGTRLKWTQTTVKYGVVVGSSFGGGNTTVTIAVNTDYTIANAAISANYYSYAANPQGYPGWFNFTPANVTGWAASPTWQAKYAIVGNQLTLMASASGTSNSATTTFDAPVTKAGAWNGYLPVQLITNNGTSAFGRSYFNTAIQIRVGVSATSDTWTASGLKTVDVFIIYEI